MTNPYEALSNAIILQAVRDWKCGDRTMKAECERFFRSHWFSCLTTLDPEFLINKLRKEYTR